MGQCIRSGFRSTAVLSLCVLLAGSLLGLSQAKGAEQQCNEPVVPIVGGQRVFTCGHSFHVFVYRILDEMAKAIPDQAVAGKD